MNRKPIFDAVRLMLGRGFSSSEVRKLDAAIDEALGVEPEGLTIGPKGIALIKEFEGCARKRPDGKLDAYQDVVGVWTIGWGSTGPDIRKGTVWTQAQADQRFAEHVAEFADGVAKAIGDAPTTQSQFDAMVSMAYNVGIEAFRDSTLLKKHKAGDFVGARAEFARWNKAGSKAVAGLTRRRAAEAQLYAKAGGGTGNGPPGL